MSLFNTKQKNIDMKDIIMITLFFVSINVTNSQEKNKSNEKESIAIDNIESGKVENGKYNCNRFKWSVKIPSKYSIIELEELAGLEKKGNKEVRKNLPDNIKIQNRTHLIGFKLNNQNTFTASFNPLEKTKKVTLEQHGKFLTELLKKSCSKFENGKFEFNTSQVTIGNYQFYKIKVEGYNKANNQLVITQIYYNSYIKEHLFGFLITYGHL